MEIRKARIEDIEEIVKLEQSAWPEGGAATSEQIEERISIFPEGVIVCVDNLKIVGTVMGELLEYKELMSGEKTWSSITGNGYISTHSNTGNVLFGVDLSVDPTSRNKGLGKNLLMEIGKLAIRKNLIGGVLGARMPDYHKFHSQVSPEEYLNYRDGSGKLIDSELRFYERNGLKLIKVLPNYFPDKESLDYGVLCLWKNPFYVKNL